MFLCVVIKKYLFLLSVKSRIDTKLLSIKSKNTVELLSAKSIKPLWMIGMMY